MLKDDQGTTISDSAKILDHFAGKSRAVRKLYPAAHKKPIREFEADMHLRLGAASRLFLYNRMLSRKESRRPMADLLCAGSSRVEKLIYPFMFTNFVYKSILSITKARKAENADAARDEVCVRLDRKVFVSDIIHVLASVLWIRSQQSRDQDILPSI